MYIIIYTYIYNTERTSPEAPTSSRPLLIIVNCTVMKFVDPDHRCFGLLFSNISLIASESSEIMFLFDNSRCYHYYTKLHLYSFRFTYI